MHLNILFASAPAGDRFMQISRGCLRPYGAKPFLHSYIHVHVYCSDFIISSKIDNFACTKAKRETHKRGVGILECLILFFFLSLY